MKTSAQLALFADNLPRKPYHTNSFATGLHIAKAKDAIKSRYIQANGSTHKYWIVLDLDYPNATMFWDEINAPAPNIIATNKENGHCHYFYALEIPIRTAPDGKVAPLRYAAAIELALLKKLKADYGYSGLICKNPLNPHWLVSTWEDRCYTLDWLADYLDLSASNGSKNMPDYGLGRNCNLFEYTRKWAYKAIRQGWPEYDRWLDACVTRAIGYNAKSFKESLPANEITHVAKSIAKWTYKHFSKAGFSEWQSRQGKKGSKEDKAKAGAIGGTKSKGGGRPVVDDSARQSKPWEVMGISRKTYYKKKAQGNLF